ncbi:MAG: zinc-binding dehydrogenase [Rhodoferax sp.]|nr:zinc-binding dehydrogenase [Rhodoferax sp.]
MPPARRAVRARGLKPVIDRCYPLDQVRDAFDRLHAGAQFGKVVVTVD